MRTLSSSLLFMKGLTTLYVVVKYQGWWVTWTALKRAGKESCGKTYKTAKDLKRSEKTALRLHLRRLSAFPFESDLQHVHHLLELGGFDS